MLATTLQDADRTLKFFAERNYIANFLYDFIDLGVIEGDDPDRKPKCSLS